MAFGDCRDDAALRDAWKQFCQRLEVAGDQAFKDSNPASPALRADAFRYLMQNMGQAWQLAFETKDTKYPFVHSFMGPFYRVGGDNADATYQQVWIDGASVYKISGNLGTAAFQNFLVHGPRPELQPGLDWPSCHEPFGDIPEANIHGSDIQTEWDGSFELYVGGPQRGPNWLPTTPGSRKMFIRQVFDRWNEIPGRFRIERLGMDAPRPVPTPQEVIGGIDWAGTFLSDCMHQWPEWAYNFYQGEYNKNINNFPSVDGDPLAGSDKQRGRNIQNMTWKLGPDEAMIIEFDLPQGLWMFTNQGPFFNSMDFMFRPVSYTTSRTKVDADGKVRLVMCHDDPGCHNWLDTQAFEQGNLTYRHFLNDHLTAIRTRVIPRDQLAAALPADTATVTHDERVRQMRERFNGIRQRYLF
jgi:hypothetical protein